MKQDAVPREKTMTLDRFLVERQGRHPQATGDFTRLMTQIGTAAKIISNYMRRAALDGLLGKTGTTNVQGEQVKKLDELGNRIFLEAFDYVDVVGMLISEEMSEVRPLSPEESASRYVLMIDPIDGSSNLDVGGVVGSIFAVHELDGPLLSSCLKPGTEQIAAGYILYGAATYLVYTAGSGVHSFVLDHDIGEFVLDQQDLIMPKEGPIFSANLGYFKLWTKGLQNFTSRMMDPENGPHTLRYSGALLADLHRILHEGGIYYYPADRDNQEGKLRLLYECAPLAYIAEQAGGAASIGRQRVMEVAPDDIHQRIPFAVGSKYELALYEQAVAEA